MDAVDIDPRSVEPQAQAVVQVARTRKDPELLGLSLRLLAGTFRARWDDSSARPLLDEAVRVTRRHGVWHVAATVLASRASVLHELGDVARGSPGPRRRARGDEPRDGHRAGRARALPRSGRALARDRRAARRAAGRVRAALPVAARGRRPGAALGGDRDEQPGARAGRARRVRRGDPRRRPTPCALAISKVPSLEGAPGAEPRLDRGPSRPAPGGHAGLRPVGAGLRRRGHPAGGVLHGVRRRDDRPAAAPRGGRRRGSRGRGARRGGAPARVDRGADAARADLPAHRSARGGRRTGGCRCSGRPAPASRDVVPPARSSSASRRGCRRAPRGSTSSAVARRAAGRLERSGDLHGAVEAYLVAGRVALDQDRPACCGARAVSGPGARRAWPGARPAARPARGCARRAGVADTRPAC